MRVARPVVLSDEQREMLEARSRARSASARSVERAWIVLLTAAGMQDKQFAAKLKIMPERQHAGGTGSSTVILVVLNYSTRGI